MRFCKPPLLQGEGPASPGTLDGIYLKLGRGLWGWSQRLTRCSLVLGALPSGYNPFSTLAEPGRQPKGASHICWSFCGEDGGGERGREGDR